LDLRAGADNSRARQLKQELASSPDAHLKEVDQGSVPDISSAILASHGLAVTTKCQKLLVANETFRICDVERKP